jgi:hypothetical protein
MLIGRSDDPQNPRRVVASKAVSPFGGGSRKPIWASGRAPRSTGRTHVRNRTRSDFSQPTPCTRGAVHTLPTADPIGGALIVDLFRVTLVTCHFRDTGACPWHGMWKLSG